MAEELFEEREKGVSESMIVNSLAVEGLRELLEKPKEPSGASRGGESEMERKQSDMPMSRSGAQELRTEEVRPLGLPQMILSGAKELFRSTDSHRSRRR